MWLQAWSDKINNLFLLSLSRNDTAPPTAGSFTTTLTGGQDAAITAIVPYPGAPSSYFVQVSQAFSYFKAGTEWCWTSSWPDVIAIQQGLHARM
jgi:hypothetical protein